MRQCQERDSQACQQIKALEGEIESQKKQNAVIEKAEQNIQERITMGKQAAKEATSPTNLMQIKLA